MRALLILLLVTTTSLFAETPAEKKRDDALYQWRVNNRLSTTDPKKYDEYAAKYAEVWNQYAVDELAAMTAACPRNTDCVSQSQKDLLQAQVRISIGLVNAKAKWIKEGKSEAEQKTAEENYNKCANENKDCDKLPETDRNSAREARGSTPVVNVTPVVADDLKAAQAKIDLELEAISKTFNDANPGWADKELNKESRDHLVNLLTQKLEKKLAALADLCKKYPGNAEVCLTAEAIAKLREDLSSESCKVDRNLKKKGVSLATHDEQWAAAAAPKCESLIALDAKPVEVTPEVVPEVVVTDENIDEKTPSNYDAKTCYWVQDLPRKVVNGPGCGPKSRSKICTGYVNCKQKNGNARFIRMSTCGPDKCGSDDAVSCTEDKKYFSRKPADESKLFMSNKVKKVISTEAQ